MNAPSENLSLRWISPDLDDSVSNARRAFEAYLADPEASNSAEKIAKSLSATQDAASIFADVDMLAAAGIAIEISAILESLQTGSCANARDCYQVVIGGFNQLLNYLALTRKLGSEEAAALLVVRSELRAVAGQPLNLADEYFDAKIPASWSLVSGKAAQKHDWQPLLEWLSVFDEKLQAIDANPDEHRAELRAALAHCNNLQLDKWIPANSNILGDCCLAFEALLCASQKNGQRVSAGLKYCLMRTQTELQDCVKALAAGDKPDNVETFGSMLEELLFFCAFYALSQGDKSLYQKFKRYDLDAALKTSTSGVLFHLGTPDVETVDLVLSGLCEDLQVLQGALRESVENDDAADAFAEHQQQAARLYYTARMAQHEELYPTFDVILQGFTDIEESGKVPAPALDKIVEGIFALENQIAKMRNGSDREEGELTVLEQVNSGLGTLALALPALDQALPGEDGDALVKTLAEFSATID
ncbi:MAG: hypothetical protein HKO84_03075, partial [Pseudomonadales bacterium]|nr:hypothetical protein [Pseudomonadales bacterium]